MGSLSANQGSNRNYIIHPLETKSPRTPLGEVDFEDFDRGNIKKNAPETRGVKRTF